MEATVALVPTRAVELTVVRVQVCALVMDRVEDLDRAVELIPASVPIHAVGPIVAKAQVLVQVIVRVKAQTLVIVLGVVLLLILVKFVNCNPFDYLM